MSSMRNAVQRRNHKERAQPRERERWGLLEKHKDYTLRAKDYNAKKKTLKALRQKATERNPDEFHFAMLSHRMQDGGKVSKASPYASMPHETAKLLKTQDAAYLRTAIQSTRKQRTRLREGLVLQRAGMRGASGLEIGGDDDEDDETKDGDGEDGEGDLGHGRGRHTVFVDDRAQQRAYGRHSLPSEGTGQDVADADSDENDVEQTKAATRKTKRVIPVPQDDTELRQRSISAREQKIEALREREKALVDAEQELEMQRARMGNSIGGVNAKGQKFRIKERKR